MEYRGSEATDRAERDPREAQVVATMSEISHLLRFDKKKTATNSVIITDVKFGNVGGGTVT